MSFAKVVGHGEPIKLLKRAIFEQRLPNAYLFAGPPNIGKTLVAVELAKAINCEQSDKPTIADEVDCCDDCEVCHHVDNGSHPNFRLIWPFVPKLDKTLKKLQEEDPEFQVVPQDLPDVMGGIIPIDQIRGLISSAYAKVTGGKRKVYVLTSAEAMEDPAANCFLRTLEEPPKDTTFILTTANMPALLPTIVSRCQLIRFHPVPREKAFIALSDEFSEIDPATIDAVVASSAGRYGWAYRLLQSEAALAQRSAVLDFMVSLPNRQLFEGMRAGEFLIEAAEQWWLASHEPELAARLLKVNRDNILRTQMNELADVMLSWWRDLALLVTCAQDEKVINTDYLPQLNELVHNYDSRSCRRACRWIQAAKSHLRGNPNLRLFAEALMMKLISLAHRR